MAPALHTSTTKSNVDLIFKSIVKKLHIYMSHFSYACKTEGENGISRLISEMA